MVQLPISVVTITKNSESRIASVVENALQFAKEHIVVDTGSTDDTVNVARSSGAKVVFYSREFDYSSPRNYGASVAGNNWIFQLDDDETFAPGSRISLEEMMYRSSADVGYVVQVNDGSIDSIQPRIIRKGQKYFGLVHEWTDPREKNAYTGIVITHNPVLSLDLKRPFKKRLAQREWKELQKGNTPLEAFVSRAHHISSLLGLTEKKSMFSMMLNRFASDYETGDVSDVTLRQLAIWAEENAPSHLPSFLGFMAAREQTTQSHEFLINYARLMDWLPFQQRMRILDRANELGGGVGVDFTRINVCLKEGENALALDLVNSMRGRAPDLTGLYLR